MPNISAFQGVGLGEHKSTLEEKEGIERESQEKVNSQTWYLILCSLVNTRPRLQTGHYKMWLVIPGPYSLKTEGPYKLFIHKREFQICQKAEESSPTSAPQIIVIIERSLQTHFSPFTLFTSLFFRYFIYKRNKGENERERLNVDKYQTNQSWDLIQAKREFAL